METIYINTGHPDFLNGHRAMAIVQERVNPKPMNVAPQGNSPPDNKKPIVPPSTTPLVGSNVNNFLNENDSSTVGGFFGSFFTGGKKKKNAPMEPVIYLLCWALIWE